MRECLTLLLCLQALFLSSVGYGEEEGARDPVSFRIRPLTYWLTKPGDPLPTRVAVQNSEAQFQGVIEATVGAPEASHVWRRRIRIGKGQFRFFLYPQTQSNHPESALTVRLLDDKGNIRGDMSFPLRFKAKLFSLLSVTGSNRRFTSQHLDPSLASVACMRGSKDLPDEWYGYKPFTAVFWDTYVTESLTPAQQAALTDWIKRGGRLILGAKAGDLSLRSPLPSLTPTLTIEAGAPGKRPESTSRFITVKEFAAGPSDLFAERKIGLGSIVFLRVDFNRLNAWPKKDILRLLGSSTGGLAKDSKEMDEHLEYESFRHTLEPESLLLPAIARLGGYTSINFMPILVTMLIYIMIVSVADYWALKRLRRLPWTWATFPAIILAFSILSFHLFYKGKLGSLVRHEFVFSDIGRDGYGRCLALSSIRNNSNNPIQFPVNDSHYVGAFGDDGSFDLYRGRRGYRRQRRTRITETVRGDGARDISLPGFVGSFCFFSEEWVKKDSKAPFESRIEVDNSGGIRGRIVNHVERHILEAFLSYQGRIYNLDKQMNLTGQSEAISGNEYEQLFDRLRYGHGRRDDPVNVFVSYVKFQSFLSALPSSKSNIPAHFLSRPSQLTIFEKAGAREGVVVAFVKEKDHYAGMPVTRVRCIRQIVEISHDRRTPMSYGRHLTPAEAGSGANQAENIAEPGICLRARRWEDTAL